ncbi:ATP-dependent helicase HrpB [Carboxylicivirga sp. N1Y90]|uniref:ATP-dependent helicase HrpB n=1 Tax=Carboxylicivirga fragile TaxID=3417571 RepID=UPI003D351988|nr:ATP-dependent helicase HrpB [Marinilabiliaceae bacterium N1Y90]
MIFDPFKVDLPITEVIDEVKEHLSSTNTLIVNAPPGAGKSTLLPLALLEDARQKGQKIIMLEPRRLAAKTIAMRMSELLGEKVGQTVGYRIRFDNVIGPDTIIEVVTEGILTRMLQSDGALEGVGMVIFDEFHERSIFADVALALCRESQEVLRPDLQIVIMSATLDMPQLTVLLNCPTVVSKGRQYPVEIKYVGENDVRAIAELTSGIVVNALKEQEGDILVFLPGEGEIRSCETLLRNKRLGVQIHPLYGQLNGAKQYAAIMPDKNGRRKIVLATSIAETSLTIEGVTTVVDSGFGRTMRFDPNTGLSRLETIEVTQDAANQRAGRAGRLGPGVCYRMWNKATHNRKQEHRFPEILDADLTSLVLDMAQWGVKDIESLCWLTTPPKGHVKQAYALLNSLHAVEGANISNHGRELHKLPCHPRLAHMLIEAKKDGLSALASDLAAILEERDPLGKESGIDINLRIEALRRYRKGDLKSKPLARIEKIARQYRQIAGTEVENTEVDPFETGLLLVHAYPERIAHAKPGNNAQFKLANGSIAAAGHTDDLAHEAWLAIAHVNAREGVGRIFLASPLNPQDLAPMVKTIDNVKWDTKKGGFSASTELRIGSIILQSKPLNNFDEQLKVEAICKAIEKEGEHLLDFNKDVVQFQNRVLSIRKWDKNNAWPDVSTSSLLNTTREWLAPYLSSVKKTDDLKKIDLLEVLLHALPYQLQTLLNKLAPERIKVPSGSNIKLKYSSDGTVPILPVRLQEVFSMNETPSVNNGNQKVLMHLLSPGFKLVQITGDLKSFWEDAYFEVRKELRARYPKHFWPENPLDSKAVYGVKKK